MSKFIKVGIIGSTGYTGVELIKILYNHRYVVLKELSSENHFNKNLNQVLPNFNLKKLPKLKKKDQINVSKLDLIFVSLPHIQSQKYISKIIDKVKIIDLSGDFRFPSLACWVDPS